MDTLKVLAYIAGAGAVLLIYGVVIYERYWCAHCASLSARPSRSPTAFIYIPSDVPGTPETVVECVRVVSVCTVCSHSHVVSEVRYPSSEKKALAYYAKVRHTKQQEKRT